MKTYSQRNRECVRNDFQMESTRVIEIGFVLHSESEWYKKSTESWTYLRLPSNVYLSLPGGSQSTEAVCCCLHASIRVGLKDTQMDLKCSTPWCLSRISFYSAVMLPLLGVCHESATCRVNFSVPLQVGPHPHQGSRNRPLGSRLEHCLLLTIHIGVFGGDYGNKLTSFPLFPFHPRGSCAGLGDVSWVHLFCIFLLLNACWTTGEILSDRSLKVVLLTARM